MSHMRRRSDLLIANASVPQHLRGWYRRKCCVSTSFIRGDQDVHSSGIG